jgi:hypothetical protein
MRPEYLSKKLTSPIPTKDGGTLRTIQQGCQYMAAISKEREQRRHWQQVRELIDQEADVDAVSWKLRIAVLKDAKLAGTRPQAAAEIARTLGVSVATLHRWRKAPPGPRPALVATHEAGQPNRLRRRGDRIAELELENSRLRQLVIDLLLEKNGRFVPDVP